MAASRAVHETDEAGAVLWARDHHIRITYTPELVKPGLTAAVRAFRGISRLAAETGWPPVTQNLWEDQDGGHLYTLGALLAAATAWTARAHDAHDREAVSLLARCEEGLRAALEAWPTDKRTGALARALIPARGVEPVQEFTPCVGLLGRSVPLGG